MRHSASPHPKQTVSGAPSSEQIGKVFPCAKVSVALTSSNSVDPHCGHLLAMGVAAWRRKSTPAVIQITVLRFFGAQ